MIYSDGSLFCGEWKSDLKCGQGIIIFDENIIYKGTFQENKPSGQGEIIFSDNGKVFNGSFEQGLRHGYGTIQFKNGSYERGNWILGKREGPFVIKEANTNSRKWTYWENDLEIC